MAVNRGRGAGITGALIDLIGTPKFWLRVYRWERALTIGSRPRNGRGLGRWVKTRPLLPGGKLTCSGKVRFDGFYLPTDWRGQEGSITIQIDTARTETVQVRVMGQVVKLVEAENDLWDITIIAEITAVPALAGFGGTQGTADIPPAARQETYEGLFKEIDPTDIQTKGGQTWDIWMLGDSDDAEMQVIAERMAAIIVPIPNTKTRNIKFNRTDSDGGFITIEFGKTTVAEDIINQASQVTIDPTGIESQAKVAGINAGAAAPIGDGFVFVKRTNQELNDQNQLLLDEYALRSPKDAIEQDNTSRTDDPNSLIDAYVICQVTDSAAQPTTPTSPIAGLKFHHHQPKQINNQRWQHSFFFLRRDTLDDIQMEGTVYDFDPNLLAGSAVVVIVSGSATAPAAPTAPIDGVKYVSYTQKQHSTSKWIFAYHYAPLDSADQVTFPHAVTTISVSGDARTSFATILNAPSAMLTANGEFAGRKSDPSLDIIEARKLTDGKVVLVIRNRDRYLIVNFESWNTGYQQTIARMISTGGSSVASVFLLKKWQVSSTQWKYILGSQMVSCHIVYFTLTTKVSGSTLPVAWGGGSGPDLRNTVNAGDFLGLPASTVSYVAAGGTANIAVSTPRVSDMNWQFKHDSNGFVKTEDLRVGVEIYTGTDLSSAVEGTWVSATSLGINTVSQLPPGDYSFFTG